MFGAGLVVKERSIHAGAMLLLKMNFLTLGLLYLTYDLFSAFFMLFFFSFFIFQSDLVGVTLE